MSTTTTPFTSQFAAAEAAWRQTETRIEALRQAEQTLVVARYDFVEASRRANHWQRFFTAAQVQPCAEAIIAGYQAEWHTKTAEEKRQRFEASYRQALAAYRQARNDVRAEATDNQIAMTASDDHPDSPPFRALVARDQAYAQEIHLLDEQIERLEADLRATFRLANL